VLEVRKIYLAWQVFSNGTKHLRRITAAGKFTGYQKQDLSALEWMNQNDNPVFPCDFDVSVIPFEVEQ